MASFKPARAFRQFLLVLALVVSSLAGGVVLDRQLLADSDTLLPPASPPNFALMKQAWDIIQNHFVDRAAIRPRRMTYAAISGMVDSLGDTGHTAFLTPEMVRQDKDVTRGEFAGIGAEIQIKKKRVVIVTPMDGSPAKRAGLVPGDIILRVGDKDVAGLPLITVAQMVRGKAGTKVTLRILDPHTRQTHDVTLVRAHIPLLSVRWHMVPGTQIAHLRIAMFSKGTAKALDKALAAAKAAGARALVLDLRDDPGGLLSEAVAVASRFLAGGDVLIEKNAFGERNAVPVAADAERWNAPLAVLINAGTASGAEIVSGALQDAHRAPLIGERTFGTGTVLEEFPLSDGSALQVAVEEWLTPNGHTIWHKGIRPNIKVSLARGVPPLLPQEEADMSAKQFAASRDAQLLRAVQWLEQALSKPPAAKPNLEKT